MSINPRIVPDAVAGGSDVLPDTAHAPGNPVTGNRGVVLVDGNGNVVKATDNGDGTATLNVAGGTPAAANVLTGSLSHAVTTGAATIITVPAGRTWVGTVGISCSVSVTAAATTQGLARGVVAVAGAGVTPSAGTVLAVDAKAAANAATGTVGSQGGNALAMPLTVIAPIGNSVTVTLASTITGTVGQVDAYASGALQ